MGSVVMLLHLGQASIPWDLSYITRLRIQAPRTLRSALAARGAPHAYIRAAGRAGGGDGCRIEPRGLTGEGLLRPARIGGGVGSKRHGAIRKRPVGCPWVRCARCPSPRKSACTTEGFT